MLLSFVDRSGRNAYPDQDAVTARLTCFNSDLPSRLPFGNPGGDFELEGGGRFARSSRSSNRRASIQPPLGNGQTWRLISQLSLNYLSLVESGEDALRETLRLYDFADSPSARKQIDGITGVRSAPTFARILTEHGLTFARGRRVEIDLDEEQFTGGGIFLFGTVLERFLGLYASINSFTVLAARSRQRKRAGVRVAGARRMEAAAMTIDPKLLGRSARRAAGVRLLPGRALLEQLRPERAPVGEFGDPGDEVVRFATPTSRRVSAERDRRRSRTARATSRRG